MEQCWTFSESMLGAALDAWAKTRRPNADTAVALKAVAEFLNSEAAGKLRVRQAALSDGGEHASR